MQDDTPVYDLFFEIAVNLSERFPAMTPLTIRRENAREVFRLISRFNKYNRKKRKQTKNGKKIIRKPAGDNWF